MLLMITVGRCFSRLQLPLLTVIMLMVCVQKIRLALLPGQARLAEPLIYSLLDYAVALANRRFGGDKAADQLRGMIFQLNILIPQN